MNISDKFQETICNIKQFESKYRIDSETFYRKYLTGQTTDLRINDIEAVEWAGEIDIALHWLSKPQNQESQFAVAY